MIKKLEALKQIGMYAVSLYFGSRDIGCDDLGVPMMERDLTMIAAPVGCLGEAKLMFKGTVQEFMDFNFSQEPLIISNPPKEKEYKVGGYFLWGTESSVEVIQERIANSG